MAIAVRRIAARDEPRWRELWDGYTRFYEREPSEPQDLFVEPAVRGGGTGRALIDWLVAEMKAQGWSRLYWNTRRDNVQARGLYDQYTEESGFVRYVLYA